MLVSVIATVRNERSSVERLLDSLLAQSRRPDEIVIADGASTDGTLAVLERYAQCHGVRVLSQPCNIAEGRNLGIRAASGTHIAVTDAGCLVDPDWLRELLARFDADEAVDVVAGNFRFETHNDFEQASVLGTFQPNRDATEAARYYPSSRSLAFKKSAWELAGGYPEWLYAAEDTLFNIRLRQVGCRFEFAQRAVVRWRPRETWAKLARQRVNFARGNGRVGIGTEGYMKNLSIHGSALALAVLAFVVPLAGLAALGVLAWHVRSHLWPQARAVTPVWSMRVRVMLVMEFVRLVSMVGFLQGRWDRLRDPRFIERQRQYMQVRSVRELEARGVA